MGSPFDSILTRMRLRTLQCHIHMFTELARGTIAKHFVWSQVDTVWREIPFGEELTLIEEITF